MMKNATRFLFALAAALSISAAGASAQSFQISNIIEPELKFGEYHAQLYITNTSSVEKNLKVKAHFDEVKMDDASYFCVGINCYPPSVTEVTYMIGANTTDSLIAYLIPGVSQGTRSVRYEFSDAENPSDKVEHTFVFSVGTSVDDVNSGVAASLSLAAPSPASQAATIRYSIAESTQGAIELYNMDSRLLKTFPLAGANGSVVIPTGEFPSGNYFYALVVNGQRVATNKLVIAH